MIHERNFGPVRFIPGNNAGKYPYSNSLYIEEAGILIDAGADPVRYQALRAGPGVREIWLSHWHEDHFGCLAPLEDLPLRQMAIEAEPLSDIEHLLDWYGIRNPEFRDYWRNNLTENFSFQPRRASSHFTPGEIIELGSCRVEVVHVPGHTPGSLAFFFIEPQVLFLGDYDLTRFGPWYGDRDSSIELTIASVQRLRQIPAQVWLTSHERGIFEEAPGEAFDNYLAVIDEREQKLIEYLRGTPRSLAEIIGQAMVYRKPRQPAAFFEWGEGAIMGKHLQRLMRNGMVTEENGRYRLNN